MIKKFIDGLEVMEDELIDIKDTFMNGKTDKVSYILIIMAVFIFIFCVIIFAPDAGLAVTSLTLISSMIIVSSVLFRIMNQKDEANGKLADLDQVNTPVYYTPSGNIDNISSLDPTGIDITNVTSGLTGNIVGMAENMNGNINNNNNIHKIIQELDITAKGTELDKQKATLQQQVSEDHFMNFQNNGYSDHSLNETIGHNPKIYYNNPICNNLNSITKIPNNISDNPFAKEANPYMDFDQRIIAKKMDNYQLGQDPHDPFKEQMDKNFLLYGDYNTYGRKPQLKTTDRVIPDDQTTYNADDLATLQSIQRGRRPERQINGVITSDKYYYQRWMGETMDERQSAVWWENEGGELDMELKNDGNTLSFPDEYDPKKPFNLSDLQHDSPLNILYQ